MIDEHFLFLDFINMFAFSTGGSFHYFEVHDARSFFWVMEKGQMSHHAVIIEEFLVAIIELAGFKLFIWRSVGSTSHSFVIKRRVIFSFTNCNFFASVKLRGANLGFGH